MKLGADISHWNKILNFDWLARELDFVILKAGGSDKGFYRDSTFIRNYEQLHDERDLPTGAYYFVGRNCISAEAGKADAERFIDIIKGMRFEYPVYIDLEATSPKHKAGATQAVKAFCDHMERNGYYVGIYASDISGFQDRLELHELSRYDKWVARYGSDPKYVKTFGIHQYTSSGHLQGIQGNVDLNHAFLDYPDIMKRGRYNNVR